MEEIKNEEVELKEEENKAEEKIKNKKNTFTLIYILVGLFLIAVLAMFLIAFMMTR